MFRILTLTAVVLVFAFSHSALSQTKDPSTQQKHASSVSEATKNKPGAASKTPDYALSVVDTIKLSGIDTEMLAGKPQCDADGNFYLRNDVTFQSPILKVNLKGEKTADFLPSSSTDLPNLPSALAHAEIFWVTGDGDLYLHIMSSMTEHDLLVFGKDGTYKSKVALDNGTLWQLKKFAVFSSGDFLITGEKWQKPEQNYAPFTAIFSSGGTFLKEISLQDDAKIYKSTVDGDSALVPHPGNNRAIFQGAMATAAGGNIYLMRWLSPAVVYAISPGGEVLRRFTVDPGDAGSMPSSMRIAGDRIAIEFRNKEAKKQMFKVVNLDGKEQAIYDWPEVDGKPVWLSLCYMQNPERFVFLDEVKDRMPALRIAEPR
jgi:hypothetical protein